MKRTYAVTVLVDVLGDNERDFSYAEEALIHDPPFLMRTSAHSNGTAFSAISRTKASRVRTVERAMKKGAGR